MAGAFIFYRLLENNMRKIVVFEMVTLDDYFAGPNGEIDWHNVDAEFEAFVSVQTKQFGGIVMGHTTYDMMQSFWSSAEAEKESPAVTEAMRNTWKMVFSKSMQDVTDIPTWKNVKVYRDIRKDEVLGWKQWDGQDIAIFGSGTIVQQFANLGLIDEYRLMLNPIILGAGKSLFKDIAKQKLSLKDMRKFENGNILLTYAPQGTK